MESKKQPEFNAKAHKLSLSRRSLCVRKKASELAILCDASICLMQFDQDGQLRTFPEDASEVNNVLKRYLRVGGKVPKKQEVSGLSIKDDEVKKPGPVLYDMHENGKGSPPSLGDELLGTKSALELQNFKDVLDVRMKKLEERIKVLKGIKSLEKKRKASTLLRFYEDGTPFNPDDLQLSCNFPGSELFSKHDGMDLAASPPDLSFSHYHLGLAANNVTGDNFSFSEQPSTNSSSCDSDIQKMNSADREHVILGNMTTQVIVDVRRQTHDSSVAEGINLLLKDDESAEKKRKTAPFQLYHQDGMPCYSDDLQMSINFCGSRSPFLHDYEGLAANPTNLLLLPSQLMEAASNTAHGRRELSKLPCSDGSSRDSGCEIDSAKEYNGLEDLTANNSSPSNIMVLTKIK